MSFVGLSSKIAENQKQSYLTGLIIGTVLYLILLALNQWNPISLITSVTFLGLSVITGLFMRFLSGLGLTLTYTTICVLVFRTLSPFLKGKKQRTTIVKAILFLPAVVIFVYSIYTMGGALLVSRPPSSFDLLSMIFGVWSLMIMVYGIPLIKNEYRPTLEKSSTASLRQKAGEWKFSIWRGYQSRIHHDYGRVASGEFERYGDQLFIIRTILSGVLLLPISFILIQITPLAVLSMILWIRLFTLNRRYLSVLERALLVIITCTVAILSTISFTQFGLTEFNLIFSISYGLGLCIGVVLLSYIILRK